MNTRQKEKIRQLALAGVAQWIVPAFQSKGLGLDSQSKAYHWVASQVPGRGARERQPYVDVSLPPSFPL